jgi:hypothetical protein
MRRGKFKSLAELKDRLLDFIGCFNRTFAKPFQWNYISRPVRNESLKRPSRWKEVWASQRQTAMLSAMVAWQLWIAALAPFRSRSSGLFAEQRCFGVFEFGQAAEVAVAKGGAIFPREDALIRDDFAGGRQILLRGARSAIGVLEWINGFAEKEAGAVKMDVRHEQRHRPAGGDFPGFVQVALRALGASPQAGETPLPGAGEECEREHVLRACAAEAGDGLFDFVFRISDFPKIAS